VNRYEVQPDMRVDIVNGPLKGCRGVIVSDPYEYAERPEQKQRKEWVVDVQLARGRFPIPVLDLIEREEPPGH
jgi:hypothetical protein